MDFDTREIIDVFHKHAKCDEGDSWARKNIHGLNLSFLNKHGSASSAELVDELKSWLANKNILFFYGNDPYKESMFLQRAINDIGLPPWIERIDEAYHKIANTFKKHSIPIFNVRCKPEAHSSYNRSVFRLTPSNAAKQEHGFHCSLCDCHEMYLFYLMEYLHVMS